MRTLLALALIGFVVSATAAPASPTDEDAGSMDRVADAARDAASDNAAFLREGDPAGDEDEDEAEADRMCDAFDTHGEYVSGVANETRDLENGSDRGATVSEAAQTDIGKCGGPDEDALANETAAANETAETSEPEETEAAGSDRGRSEGARSEHPPENGG